MTDQLAPDAAQIRLHLEILFSDLDALGPYPNGLFELRFLPPMVVRRPANCSAGATATQPLKWQFVPMQTA